MDWKLILGVINIAYIIVRVVGREFFGNGRAIRIGLSQIEFYEKIMSQYGRG